MPRRSALLLVGALLSCHKAETAAPAVPAERPSILLVTLDTTRADAIGPEAKNVSTPAFNAIAARGLRFRYAYATVPQTLPSHTSMLTGLYPAGHGVHENARFLATTQPLVTERLREAGYRTAAFVSAFALAKRFGLARGFDVYDEDFGSGKVERTAKETTDRVLAWLQPSSQPLFLWVHYYDPHFPYTPPEPYASRYAKEPYYGEVASMDEQLGRLVQAFDRLPGPKAILLAGDHGEGLGEHGEQQHGNLLYQSTMHVPFVVVGPGVKPGTSAEPVSTRTIFQTILNFAGIERAQTAEKVIAGEAMKPFLDYGWQPQVMAVEGRQKTILAGRLEVYDVVADPAEADDISSSANISRDARATLRDYPAPSPAQPAQTTTALDEESRRKLAALGYVASTVTPVVRTDAPRPADMARLFPVLDLASGLFVRGQYKEAIPLLQQIQREDPSNLDAALRLATAYSSLGRDADALAAFRKADAIAPDSRDVRTYLALHYARTNEWPKAVPMLERIVAEEPDRVPPLEALSKLRERQGRLADAVELRRRVYTLRTPTAPELVQFALMEMSLGQTEAAIEALEKARTMQGAAFAHDLDLGVLYLAAGRLEEARTTLDRVRPGDRGYAMALFKRAQVSVLLHEPDAQTKIASAREHADATTRELIARERLFSAGPSPR